jgi:hypothetical protein
VRNCEGTPACVVPKPVEDILAWQMPAPAAASAPPRKCARPSHIKWKLDAQAAFSTQLGNCTSAAVRGAQPPSPLPPPSPPSPPPAPPSPQPSATPLAEQKNVLHVIVDDLRPQLGAYGRHDMHTPHVDALAAKSMVFDRAYVQVALCGPTRTSFLTGRRPDASRTFDFGNNFRESSPGIPGVGDKWQPLPEIFRNSGTHLSLGTGKVCVYTTASVCARPRLTFRFYMGTLGISPIEAPELRRYELMER